MSVIALAGNPNCGKTTLFNRLTKSRLPVGNRSGVTVEAKKGRWGEDTLVDLPGVYSLSASSAEEVYAKEFLKDKSVQGIINIADAENLERGLYLTVQLMALGQPMVVVINMADRLEKIGMKIDTGELERSLGVPVILVSASKGMGLDKISMKKAKVPRSVENTEEWIQNLCKKAILQNGENILLEKSIKADRILLGRYAFLILLLVMGAVFFLTFQGAGKYLSSLLEYIFLKGYGLIEVLLKRLCVNDFVKSLVCDGILKSVGAVVPFFGQIFVLFFCLSLLEDVGYMPRAIVAADRLMSRLGLDGRGIVSVITSFGCTVPAAMTARNIDNKKMRKKTLTLLPFLPCSAKLPVFVMMSSAFLKEKAMYFVTALYLTGIAFACIYAKLSGEEEASSFAVELPPYRKPTMRNTFNQLWEKFSDFSVRVGEILFLCGVIVWFLGNFDFSLHMTEYPEKSILGVLGRFIAPVFAPCGFGNWQASVSLLSGFMAKEAILSSLEVVSPGEITGLFTPASLKAFLVFVLLYPPCFAALGAIKGEGGIKEAVRVFFRQLIVAWIMAVIVYCLSCR